MQRPAVVALSDAPIAVQPVVVVVNETLSVADPPAEVNVIGVPTVPVVVEFDTVSATVTSPRMTGAPDSASPEPPHPARSITAHAMTAPAAFPLPERELNPLNRLRAALMEAEPHWDCFPLSFMC